MTDPKEVVDALLAEVKAYRSLETHNGWLLAQIKDFLKASARAEVMDSRYTAWGVEAKIWLPLDGKTYRIEIQEDRGSNRFCDSAPSL